ncbi:DUF2254 domain-containing protein [Arthrobacter sp. Bz4]|uniref:DUF2254 domain-containing protein n=1 Tax=Arthrobacter sp. Bz4 TaxID=2171979 RepID=UPI000D51E290|nr:DUF2254 domain-containing protein [Arthrobacter sp. Bz4]PVE19695.1 DUF2254 domain-containing protein [Arthrobacter sp. Bz4]
MAMTSGPTSRIGDKFRAAGDALRTQLWPLPVFAVLVAIGLGVWLPLLDAAIGEDMPSAVSYLLINGGPDAGRAILEATAGSLITATSLTFSLTVVTLQLASSQFSPRLLRTFTGDRVVHATLALFLGTFAYALTVLRTVRSGEDGEEAFVPHIAVTFAFLLAIASVIGLVFFLAHLAREIRVETIMRKVHGETAATVERVFPDRRGSASPVLPVAPDSAALIVAAKSGFLTGVDEERILAAAVKHHAIVRVDCRVGSSLVKGVPMAVGWARSGEPSMDDEALKAFRHDVVAAFNYGFERTAVQDVAFGFRQLIDVAAKALSPGINDPTTAIHVLGHTSALLCDLTQRELGERVLRDDDGLVRVILHRPDFAAFLNITLDQPVLYGSSDPAVVDRVLSLLQEVAWHAADEDKSAVREQLQRVAAAIRQESHPPAVQEHLQGRLDEVNQALDGVWSPRGPVAGGRV